MATLSPNQIIANANKPTNRAIQHQLTHLRKRIRGVNVSVHAASPVTRAAGPSVINPLTPATSSPLVKNDTATIVKEMNGIAKPTPASATSVFAKPSATTDKPASITSSGTKIKSETVATTKPPNAFTSRLTEVANGTNGNNGTATTKTPTVRKRKADDLDDEGSMSDHSSTNDEEAADDGGNEFRKTPSRVSLPRRSKSATPAYEVEKTDAAALEEGSEASDGEFDVHAERKGPNGSGRKGMRRVSASARKGMGMGANGGAKRTKLDDVSEGDE